mgnify:CR=1 FL=1
MNVLLSLLQKSPDYMQLLQAVEAKQAAAVSGLSQAPRSHVLAALHEHSGRPLVAVCQDDLAASRLASELGAFLGEQPPVLPSRELTLAGAIGVSRQWEQKRLRLLYALAQGQVPVLVTSLDALLLRTMPREVLFSASVRLRCGAEYNVDDLVARLTRAGYTRSSLVEGVGQFALRGGILDVYSPACENPLRAEFFGDELDTMGYFDPITQRRTENVEEAVLLPVAETEAHLHPQGTAGLPMLEVFRREGVENVVCVVTRYFGGVLLGTGGLLRAYTKSAKDALDAAGIAAVRRWVKLETVCPYSLLERMKTECMALEGAVSDVEYGADVRMSFLLPEAKAEAFCARVTELSAGQSSAKAVGEELMPVRVK